MEKIKVMEYPATPLIDGSQVSALALSSLAGLLDEDLCRAWLFNIIRPGDLGTVCPICTAPISERRLKAYRNFKKTLCRACGKQFLATTGTIFHRVRLSPPELILVAALIEAGTSVSLVASAVGRCEETVRAWTAKLNSKVWADKRCDQ